MPPHSVACCGIVGGSQQSKCHSWQCTILGSLVGDQIPLTCVMCARLEAVPRACDAQPAG
jgi:hypothetical protein